MTSLRAPVLAASAMIGVLSGACAPSPGHASGDEAKVEAVLARTKSAGTTYAVYQWQRITPDGAPAREEWAAEFNAGHLHRVETVEGRVIANCETMAGSYLPLSTGAILTGPRFANAACGIDTNRPMTDQRWLGVVQTPFGKADRVRLIDDRYIRSYDITDRGVIVRAVYRKSTAGNPLVLVQVAVALSSTLLSGQLFDEASLQRSFVPERYKSRPDLPASALRGADRDP